uniref:NAC domain-containing protein n=1 Tax=Tanacetum cinerariifolium TaxID=118510 RepID=A0A6L2MZ65_TANCI|nr:hypothetical protein [Tanacetum cinerariifolium]
MKLQREEHAAQISTPSLKCHVFSDNDDDEYSIQYMECLKNSSNAITTSPPVLPIEDPEDLVPILSEFEDTSGSDSECILPSLMMSRYPMRTFNVKIYSNPLFEFDEEYISSDVNPLFDEVLEDIDCKDSYDSNLNESTFLVTPLSDSNEDEYFTPGDDVELLLHHDPYILKMSVASILEGFTDEPPLKENDDLFDLESKNDEWKKILYDAPIDDLMTEDKVFDPGIHDQIFSPTYDCPNFKDSHARGFQRPLEFLSLYMGIRILDLIDSTLDGDDDDDDYDKESIISTNTDIFKIPSSDAITTSLPVLPIEDHEDSLIMGNEELNTILEKELDVFIKSSVEYLIPIPSESEDTSENDKDISQVQDVVLREKLFRITRLISNIESFNDNSTPDHVFNSFEFDNSLLDNFSLEFETFCYHSEETRSGNTTHADYSLPEYDSFRFEIEPDQERSINLVENDIPDNSSNDALLEEVDLFLFDDSIPPGIENFVDDLEGDIRFLEELLIDDSILSYESFDSSFEDNTSIPRPPLEPPDDNFDLEPEVISAVMEDNDEPDEHFNPRGDIFVSTNNEDVDYFPFMFVI